MKSMMHKGNYQSSCSSKCNSPCTVHQQASGFAEHEGNTQRPNIKGIIETARKLGQHGAKEQGPYGTMMAEGGKVGGAKTSTTGNKTKTGGSNPGGASTGGAGTVTITTGNKPPQSISVSGVGGKTDARNPGGMDPAEEDEMMLAEGGQITGNYADTEDGSGLDMIHGIMKQHQDHYSQGGKVANRGMGDLSKMADSDPNNFDDLSLRDDLEFSETGANSGDFLDNSQEDDDRKDIVAMVMKKRKKQTNPRPA